MEVLVSCVNGNIDLYNKMNIQTNSIIINQTNQQNVCSLIEKKYNGKKCKFFTFNEFGVGLSRNNALMRASEEICIMADEDEVFVDGYEDIINNAYKEYPDADMIVFDVRIHEGNKIKNRVKRNGRVRFYNSLKYGTVTFTFKRNAIIEKNIFFSLLFGGGAPFLSGEDSLFIYNCLKNNLKVYSCDKIIADVYNDNSSWFNGYNSEYLIDRGALFYSISPKLYYIYILQFAIRRHKLFSKISIRKSIKLMLLGRQRIKNRVF